MMYDVSVIIPVYNGEEYLKKCLDSICNQTLHNIEIICINDGSTDGTLSILNKYANVDERIKVISTENNGQGSARNTALNIAMGQYIAFVDADDWVELNTYELLYNKAIKHDLDLLFFQMLNYMDDTGKIIETDLYNHDCFERNNISEEIIFNHENTINFIFEIPVCPVSKLYKKKFLEKNNLRFPEGRFFEDNSFFYNSYFKCNKAGFLQEHLYYRRRHANSVTQTFNEDKFDIVMAANDILDIFSHQDYNIYKTQVVNHTFSMLLEWFNKSPLEIKQKFYNYIKYNFKGCAAFKKDFKSHLTEDNLTIYDSILNNDCYLDCLAEYKLNSVNYTIFSGDEITNDNYQDGPKYKISVIIPIYNNEKYIHRTLMSIENQTIGINNLEVLLIDDSSTDNTFEVIKQYCSMYENFKCIHIKNGTGSAGTPRNIGLRLASSDYVIFLDHDDLFEVNALKTLYDTIKQNDCDFVYGTYVSVDNGVPTKIIYPNEKWGYFKTIQDNVRAISFPPPSIWTKLFKKDFLINNDIYFPTILGEDAIFMSKSLMNANGVVYLGDSIICYHVLDELSKTNNISYDYLVEGFTSEEYLYNYYTNSGNEHFYKIRGEGILDFYLNQFFKANLNPKEIEDIFPLLYDFVFRLFSFGLTPHVNKNNEILFKYVLDKNIKEIINLKGFNKFHSKKIKFKNIVRRLLSRF